MPAWLAALWGPKFLEDFVFRFHYVRIRLYLSYVNCQAFLGLRVPRNEWGSWEVLLKKGGERKKRAVGKGEENFEKAIRAAEMLALKMDISLEGETGNRIFGMVIEHLV